MRTSRTTRPTIDRSSPRAGHAVDAARRASPDGGPQPIVVARGLRVSFSVPGGDPVEILHGIDLEVDEGGFTAIMGPSGSGKSTLLYALSGLCPVSGGLVELAGVHLSTLTDPAAGERLRLERLGFVFQQPHLLEGLSLLENVALPADWHPDRASRRGARIRARELVERMGVGPLADHDAASTSGGQRQRAGIARALVNDPRALFADEPTGALDSDSADAVLDLLLQVNARGVSVLLVTHDPRVAARASRLLVLADGRVRADVDLDPFTPESLEARARRVQDVLAAHR